MTTCRKIFTFSWPLRGRGVDPSGQPDRFFRFVFDAFTKRIFKSKCFLDQSSVSGRQFQHLPGNWPRCKSPCRKFPCLKFPCRPLSQIPLSQIVSNVDLCFHSPSSRSWFDQLGIFSSRRQASARLHPQRVFHKFVHRSFFQSWIFYHRPLNPQLLINLTKHLVWSYMFSMNLWLWPKAKTNAK